MQFPRLHLPKGSIGEAGETIACVFLKRKGYKILVRNFRTKIGEIDIICQKAGAYIFVEVKTIKENSAFVPEMHFTQEKLRKMQRTALLYFKSKKMSPETTMQFDLLAIELDGKGNTKQIRHYENLGE